MSGPAQRPPRRPPSGLRALTPDPSQPCPGPSGLCGNFNGLEGDDFKTPGGLVEATGAGLANSWKAQSSCRDKLDWLDDPCSLSIESGEAWPLGSWPCAHRAPGGTRRAGVVWRQQSQPSTCCRLPCGWFMVAHGGSLPSDMAEGPGLLIAGWWPSSGGWPGALTGHPNTCQVTCHVHEVERGEGWEPLPYKGAPSCADLP